MTRKEKWWYGIHVEGETGFLSDERYPGSYSRFNLFICDSIDRRGQCQKLSWKFKLVQQSKRFVPGFLVGIKDIDFVGRSEAETP